MPHPHKTTAEQDPRREDSSQSDSYTNTIPSHDPEPADTELRSRFKPSSIAQTHSTQTERGGGGDGGGDGDGDRSTVSLRLIMSENSMTVDVNPNCTLGELRRYIIAFRFPVFRFLIFNIHGFNWSYTKSCSNLTSFCLMLHTCTCSSHSSVFPSHTLLLPFYCRSHPITILQSCSQPTQSCSHFIVSFPFYTVVFPFHCLVIIL